jgi:exopolysaccharide production protein ExoZ
MQISSIFYAFNNGLARFFFLGDRPDKFPAVSGLRGLASLMVFIVHIDSCLGIYAVQDTFSGFLSRNLGAISHIGADVFLVLAGFFTYKSIISKSSPVGEFFMSRLLRIYPCFFMIFVIYVSLSFVFPQESKIPHGTSQAFLYLLQNLLLLPGIFSTQPMFVGAWFLSYLTFFTAVAVIIVSCLRMRDWPARRRLVFLGCALICFFAYNLLVREFRPRLGGLFIGALLFELMGAFPVSRNFSLVEKTIAGIALVIGLIVQYACHESYLHLPVLNHFAIEGPLHALVISLWAGLLSFVVMTNRGWVRRLFSIRLLVWQGGISYSFYLIHGLCLKGVAHFFKVAIATPGAELPLFWFGLLSTFLLSWVCAKALYHFVERRFTTLPSLTAPARQKASPLPQGFHALSEQ